MICRETLLHLQLRVWLTLFVLMSVVMPVFPKSLWAQPAAVLRNVRLIDGRGGPARENVDLLIENARIKSISPAGEITFPENFASYDYTGKTVIPGLISVHSHVGQFQGLTNEPEAYQRDNVLHELRQYEAYGVTSLAALGLNRPLFYELRNELHAGAVTGADLFGADRGIGVMGGVPGLPPARIADDQLDRPETAEQASEAVKAAKARGTDLIKIWVDDALGKVPTMKTEIFAAVIDEAHRHGLKVASHIYNLDDAKNVVKAGVDIIAHGVRDQPVDEELIKLLKARSVWYVPTIVLDESGYAYADQAEWTQSEFAKHALQPALKKQIADPEWRKKTLSSPQTAIRRTNVEMNQRNTAVLHEAGVKIAFGTDSGAFPERVPGLAEHRELVLMAMAGIEPQDLLQIATRNSAAALGLEDRGILVPGKFADLVIVEGDPLHDLGSLQEIVAVWHRGQKVSTTVADLNP